MAAGAGPAPCRVLLVDNYDSYTFNLFQRLLASGATGGLEPIVITNDQLSPYASRRLTQLQISPFAPSDHTGAHWRFASLPPKGPRWTSCCPTLTPSCSRQGPADPTAQVYATPHARSAVPF